jgi:hypothetical protein
MAGNKTFAIMAEPASAQSSSEDLRTNDREKDFGNSGQLSGDGTTGSGQDRLDRRLA